MKNEKIKVAVADDHPVIRKGVQAILGQSPEIELVAEYVGAVDVMTHLKDRPWAVLVLDINLKDGNGVELTQQIIALQPQARILILSIYPEDQYAMRALRAGAMGYLNKDSIPDKLVDAVTRIGRGKRFISEALADILAQQALVGDSSGALHSRLSDREFQVLCLFAAGKANQEIASHMHVSPKTVSTYRARILEKLGLKTTADLIGYALLHNLNQN
ncbi:MAG: response regulator transcription factor [bacterium]|nr:response regulator transcription factor [bacterium]